MVIKMIHTRVSLLSHFVAIFNPPFSWQHGIIQVLRSAYPQVFQLANLFWELLQAILVKVQHLQQNVKPKGHYWSFCQFVWSIRTQVVLFHWFCHLQFFAGSLRDKQAKTKKNPNLFSVFPPENRKEWWEIGKKAILAVLNPDTGWKLLTNTNKLRWVINRKILIWRSWKY